ncbi:MAG: sigma-54 dependent transcriptional regulator [Desulfobacterales bacterium]|nr:sigma-54 dependent transcriptional regulator [Desulfobacterales bacterium]
MENLRSILLVDADDEKRCRLAKYLRKQIECVVVESNSPKQALRIFKSGSVSLVISDLFLPGKSGQDLLRKVHRLDPGVITIAVVPEGERELVCDILNQGVFFYVQSPYNLAEVAIVTTRALKYAEAVVRSAPPELKFRKSDGFCGIIGNAPKMRRLFSLIDKVARDDASTVIIQGESGTGKELVARAIHRLSARQPNNFVPLNCAAIPGELLESELFGYVKGAFTGAAQSKVGRVAYADKGTLFLDEIGDMSPTLQAKLLRVLQEREFEPVGGLKSVKVDIRVIAATHRDLDQLVADGSFREDLYYRLHVLPINIPPLRERYRDIPLLINKFVQRLNNYKKGKLLGFDRQALDVLRQYPWPGNVRELENLVQRMSIVYEGRMIGKKELPARYQPDPKEESNPLPEISSPPLQVSWTKGGIDFNSLTCEFENHLIRQALSMTDGNKKEAARLLSLKRTTLLEKIKKKRLEGTEWHARSA